MKFVALVSGGKDSFYSILQAQKYNHELICCAHLTPPQNVLESNSFMYQSAASNVVPFIVKECIGVPLFVAECGGKSKNTSLVYNCDNEDEVEDLFQLLQKVKESYPDIEGVCSGAILSNYQRVRVENVCSRLNLTPLSYLWRIGSQQQLLESMLSDGVDAVLVKTAAPGLHPRKHLNRSLSSLYGYFEKLKDKFDFHMCGEGGEYETLMLDCPLYKKKLVLDDVDIVYPDDNEDGDLYEGVVGLLRIHSFHAEEKEQSIMEISSPVRIPSISNSNVQLTEYIHEQNLPIYLPKTKCLPGGLFHISELLAPNPDSSVLDQTQQIFNILQFTLQYYNCSALDVVFVHVYLSHIDDFAQINLSYSHFFGKTLPPSRSCVSVGENVLPGKRSIMMDICVQNHSGNYMRQKSNVEQNPLRNVLHVQGLSHWAPICVGPYSQANTIRGCMIMLAGQIGLLPSTMTLPSPDWEIQLNQCWKNTASVLDSFQNELNDCLGVLIYLSNDIVCKDHLWKKAHDITNDALQTNGGIVPGFVDERKKFVDYGGYEDEETYHELEKDKIMHIEMHNVPVTIVLISQMPKKSLAEIEIVCGTKKAISNIGIQTLSLEPIIIQQSSTIPYGNARVMWNCGYENTKTNANQIVSDIQISANVRYIPRCCAMAWISAGQLTQSSSQLYDLENVISEMMYQIIACAEVAGMNKDHVLHIRFYYVARKEKKCDDGIELRKILNAEIRSWFGNRGQKQNVPAFSVIPVHDLESGLFAAQVMINDLIHAETEMWINFGRESD